MDKELIDMTTPSTDIPASLGIGMSHEHSLPNGSLMYIYRTETVKELYMVSNIDTEDEVLWYPQWFDTLEAAKKEYWRFG